MRLKGSVGALAGIDRAQYGSFHQLGALFVLVTRALLFWGLDLGPCFLQTPIWLLLETVAPSSGVPTMGSIVSWCLFWALPLFWKLPYGSLKECQLQHIGDPCIISSIALNSAILGSLASQNTTAIQPMLRLVFGLRGGCCQHRRVDQVPGAPKEPKRMAQYPKIETIGSIGSITFAILEVQVDPQHPKTGCSARRAFETPRALFRAPPEASKMPNTYRRSQEVGT